jgi:hypothetical protein
MFIAEMSLFYCNSKIFFYHNLEVNTCINFQTSNTYLYTFVNRCA